MKIGIVGAGAAGLSAAVALKEKGCNDIVLLERERFVGGKCRSVEYEGRLYEVGAGITSADSVFLMDLIEKYGVEVEQVKFEGADIFVDDGGREIERPSFLRKALTLGPFILKYRKLVQGMKGPGFNGWSDLAMPFAQWASQNNLEGLVEEFAYFFTGFGYGYLDEIPAAYVLKYYSWPTLKAFMKKQIYHFPNGIQNLWVEVARDFDVRLGMEVREVIRGGEKVKVRCEGEDFEFDKLIWAGPVDEYVKFCDLDGEECEFLSKVQFIDYRTYVLRLKNFTKMNGYFPGNLKSSRRGHPVFWYHQYPDSDLYTFYVMGDFKISDDAVLANLRDIIGKMGGEVLEMREVFKWKYFPHVGSEEIADGYYDKLEALQGKDGVCFAGEFLNFSTVGLSAQYSKALVERFFVV